MIPESIVFWVAYYMFANLKKINLKMTKSLDLQFSTSVPQEFLKHATPDHLVRGTDFFFPLRLSS